LTPAADVKTERLVRVYESRKRKHLVGPSTVSRVLAVDDLNLEIPQGELFGLLGPNGAGKTTTVKILSTLLTPTSGRAWVKGLDVTKDAEKVRRIVNMVAGGERMLYYRLTGRENLNYFAELYDVPTSEVSSRVRDVLERVGLQERGDDEVEKYSKGMKQRLQIARGLINDPQVLFLDEPTIGLDVDIAKELRSFVRKQLVEEQGKTVLLTTHYLAEAEELCDRVAFIFKGKIVAQGTPSELSRLIVPRVTVELTVRGASETEIRSFAELMDVKILSVESLEDDPSQSRKRVLLDVDSEEIIPRAFEHFHSHGASVVSAGIKQPSLEDAYLKLAGK
jgi:ABC-2 type transport system ATP-binding protein